MWHGWRRIARTDSSPSGPSSGRAVTQPASSLVSIRTRRQNSPGSTPASAAAAGSDSPSAHSAPGTCERVILGQIAGSHSTGSDSSSSSARTVSAAGIHEGSATIARMVLPRR